MTSRQTNIHHFASTQASGGGSVRGMHQIGYAIVILAAALYGLLFAQPAFAQSGMISGTVTDSANNPIENITVELYQESFTPIFGTMWSSVSYTNTATSGNFAFPGLDAGKYRLYIYDANSTPRYQNEYFDNAADLDSATDINLAANENRSNIAVQLANLGSISGRVTIPGGGPLPNAQINLYTYATCCAYWAQFSTYAADANGDYTLPGLPTGTYRIGVYDSSYPSMYQAEFYQDAADVESATDIPVGDGEDVTGIDVELAKFGTISGRVLDTNSAPLANISIQIYGNDPCCGWIPIYSVSTNPSGYYTVTGLISGTYRVEFIDNNIPTMFQSEYYDSVATLAAAADVVVTTGQDVINVDAVLAKLGSISGSVTDDGNRPLSMIQVYAYALDSQNCCGAWSAQTDAEGHFIIPGLPSGAYKVYFVDNFTFPSLYQPEYFNDVKSLEDADAVQVGPSEDVMGIDAQLIKYGSISGRVTNSNSDGLSGISINLFQVSPDPCCPNTWNIVQNSYTDFDGNFTFSSLTSGVYRIGYQDNNFPLIYEPEFYNDAQTVESATDIMVGEGETVTGKDAVLSKAGSISGQVTDEQGNPLADVQISSYCCAGTDSWFNSASAQTDSEGNYLIQGLSAGGYRLFFSKPSYQYEFYEDRPTLESATDIVVITNQNTANINAQLARPSSISGHITDPDGNPASDWCAYLRYFNALTNEWEALESDCQFGQDDDKYAINRVPVGTFRMEFARVNNLDDSTYRREFYNNAFTIEEAADIVVTSGQFIENIDAILDKRTHISGRVTDGSNKALENISVGVYKRGADTPGGGQTWELATSDTTDSNGEYTIYDLPAGSYRVGFSNGNALYKTEYYDNAYYVQNGQDVVLGDGGIADNINAQLEGITLNVPPLAVQDAMTVTRGSTATQLISGASVLTNDSDAEGSALTAVLVDKPQHGALTLNADGTFTYTHDGSAAAADSFTYKASDGQAQSSAATVTITVGGSQPQQHFSFLPLSYR